jgi:predicted dehydrogenase
LKILICGAGSVGVRHAKNLIALKNEIAFYTKRKKIFLNNKTIKSFSKIKLAYQKFKPEVVFITNETSKHINTALYAVKKNSAIFIEKPLTNKKNNIKKLINIIKKKKIINMVGYMMRFHPAIITIKKMIIEKKLGRIFHFYSEWGEYLPDWHKNENYKKSYAANKSLGGGAALTLSHDLDLASYLFGEIKNTTISKINGGLGIKAETSANIFMEFKNKISGLIHVDYLQKTRSRYLKIVGTKKIIEFFYDKNCIKIYDYKKNLYKKFKKFKRNDMFIHQAKYFLKKYKNKLQCSPNIIYSYKLLKNSSLIT